MSVLLPQIIETYRWYRQWRRKRRLTCTVTIKKPEMRIRGRVQDLPEHEFRHIAFLGIPYALPPIDYLRFKPPQPLTREPYFLRPKLLKAYKMPRRCIQYMSENKCKGSEDCLYLNVFIPMKPKHVKKLLPVLVFIHGGGFDSGNCRKIDPDCIVGKEHIVLVTFHYRLGPFGFLDMRTDECRGNAGLKDQVMVLRWIRNNIECFGGDPENVTISGHSAGATAVNLHMISPLSKGLFHRAIVQAGGIHCPWGAPGDAKQIKALFKKKLQMENEMRHVCVKAFREFKPKTFLYYSREIKRDQLQLEPNKLTVMLKPTVESIPQGAFLPKDLEILMSEAEAVPTIAGITKQEGYLFYRVVSNRDPVSMVKKTNMFREFLKQNLRWDDASLLKLSNDIRTMYFTNLFHNMHDRDIREALARLVTDISFRRFYDNFKIGTLLHPGEPSLRVYHFKYYAGRPINRECQAEFWPRASEHGDDTLYVLGLKTLRSALEDHNVEQVVQVSRIMCELWASFCRDGNPICLQENIIWEPHTEENPRYLEISNTLTLKNGYLNDGRWIKLNEICQKATVVPPPEISSQTPSPELVYRGI